MAINRRKVLGGAGLAGAAALGGAGVDRALSNSPSGYPTVKDEQMTDDAARFGDPRIPAELITDQSHVFRLGALPTTDFDGGSLRQAHEDNFPILKGQQASVVFVTLQPGGIREPHWHPSAWEISVVVSGVATWTLLDPQGHDESFDAHPGDVVFAPQGSLHYFENKGREDLHVIIVFNASTQEGKDDIGIGASISKLPPRVLSAVFGVPAETFNSFKKIDKSITILK
ncbi:cupin domain-containing protein [Mycobacterium kyorinense]|uniref:Cupin n=1 Tax=Mycobacterium kyorinense TaxID=487514 RepID=A0A1X1Y0D6_9MYCO|nr:cupin domain-containing protein [Mycobacterium kyorinense]ORW04558.1 cupin [Mycobacterium kyorinense]